MPTIVDLQTVATAALADAKTAVAAIKSELAAAEAVVATKGVQLTQTQAAHDAIAVAHAAATGAASVAPKAASAVTFLSNWKWPIGAVVAAAIAYAKLGLHLF